jgi:homoprotocatechuate degradation regulator HpaR
LSSIDVKDRAFAEEIPMPNAKPLSPASEMRSTDRSLPIALLRARETVMLPIREMLSRSNISEQKWRVLRVVSESGPMDQTLIAERACLLLPSLTRIIKAMEQDALLVRTPGADDKRKSMVTITQKGQGIIDTHAAESNALFQKLQKDFGREDMRTLLNLLEKLQNTDI